MKPSMTATNPTLIPAISLPPEALPLVEEVGEAAEPVAVPVTDAVAPEVLITCVSPIDGSLTLPLTSQPPAVDEGQAGGVRFGV
jgi:hypothetical protein